MIDPADAVAPSVEVGATVRLRDDETGKTEVWTIVLSGSDPEAGKISADTPLSKALLGRRVGDVASVAAGRGRRYLIEGIDPAPVKPAPAPAPRPSRERPASFSAEIAAFGAGQDAEYEEWVRRNSGGYVLKRRDTAGEGYMLHLADCGHLALTPGAFPLRTGEPAPLLTL